jgi:alkaline phosphatase D
VQVVAAGLEPGARYRYRFGTDAGLSPAGSTRTAPPLDAPSTLRLGVASCQRYSDGFWPAHRDLAAADLDVVLFLGDFVYESAGTGVRPLPGDAGRAPATDLDGYRLRYEVARAEPDLAAAAAAHPWLVTWDDHEVADDYDGETVDTERRAAGYQAWWEHQPTRLGPPDAAGRLRVHRTLRWGTTATLALLDCRQHRSVRGSMLGEDQTAWTRAEIEGAETAWTVLGSSVVFSPVDVDGRVNDDAWDGFPAERDDVAEALRAGAGRPLVLSGDVHAEVVLETPGRPAVPELVCPSISSLFGDSLGAAASALPDLVPNVRHAADRRGWLRVDLDSSGDLLARYRNVVDAADPDSAVVDGSSFRL